MNSLVRGLYIEEEVVLRIFGEILFGFGGLVILSIFNWLIIFCLVIIILLNLKLGGLGLCLGSFGILLRFEMFEKKELNLLVLLMGWISILLFWYIIEGGEGFCFFSWVIDLVMCYYLLGGIDLLISWLVSLIL